ncbi:helix-turn-helix transcriptional regulator [Streptacidiphilus sp. 4-A2]|nr:helix-turn-helix transcriptional regulator [Streptacidiphilus sp. 4-A2]
MASYRRYGTAAVLPAPGPAGPVALTARQAQILHVIALGLTDQQIAWAGGIAVNSVKTHKRRIFKLLGARNSAHAVGIALRCGLLGLADLFPRQ